MVELFAGPAEVADGDLLAQGLPQQMAYAAVHNGVIEDDGSATTVVDPARLQVRVAKGHFQLPERKRQACLLGLDVNWEVASCSC